MKKTAIYPGTFDPITNGHFDIIERTLVLFDKLIIAVAISHDKKPMFTLDERINMVKESVKDMPNVIVVGFDNLTVELARSYNATVLIRGLRAVSDFAAVTCFSGGTREALSRFRADCLFPPRRRLGQNMGDQTG